MLTRRGFSVNAARKLAILVCVLIVVPIAFASRVDSLWGAVTVLAFATAGHQGWAANMLAMISDIYPRNAVSTATGIAGFGGSVGGMVVASAVGLNLGFTGSHTGSLFWR